jgi:methyl-accepting chemotaxis protein
MTKGNLINVDGGYELGKDIHLKVLGSGKEIFDGKVALDTSHFLQTNYKVDEEQVKVFSAQLQEELKKDFDAADADVKDKFEKIKAYREQKREKVLTALPDFKTFTQEYIGEIKNLIDELNADPNIKKFFDTVSPFIELVSKFFEDMVAILSEQLTTTQEFLTQIYSDFSTGFNEKIMPEIRKLYEQAQELMKELIDNATKAVTAAFERAAKALKEFEADFNRISQSFKDLTGGTMESLTQSVKEIIQEVKDLYEQFKEQFKNLPGKFDLVYFILKFNLFF